ncbi:MAG: hypothetical protein WBC78_00465, partial [Candidatus Sulfotelmatobacter sp.]
MNKELFVSSTPHETKVGLVEDDLLAEIYLERENEYTLAGSIYKGRVTRVLPGMQSAFVDIGLERDAFLYVSDFMELEEHDEDLTDSIPANRGVQDLRTQPEPTAMPQEMPHFEHAEGVSAGESEAVFEQPSDAIQHDASAPSYGSPNVAQDGSDGAERDRGGYRGRRRRRGGRRDGRGEGRDRGSEPRIARPPVEASAAVVPAAVPRPHESGRTPSFGPPAGYQPILLPGESISKYRGLTPQPAAQEPRSTEPATGSPVISAPETAVPVASSFPDDEPMFASPNAVVPAAASIPSVVETPKDEARMQENCAAASASVASTSVEWKREFRRPLAIPAVAATDEPATIEEEVAEEVVEEESEVMARPAHASAPSHTDAEAPVFAAPGTLEEETIDEEEADTVRYEESSDEGYDEFEEETRAVGQAEAASGVRILPDVRETVDEIHMSSLAESGAASADGNAAESEEDSEELELEEAQAEAEAMLEAEAGGGSPVDTRAEVRAPAGTVGYTQRAPRPRPGYDRQRG